MFKKKTKYDKIEVDGEEHQDESVATEAQTQDAEAEEATEETDKPVEPAPTEDDGKMTVNVKGTDDKTHKIRISAEASVTELKDQIASVTEFTVDRQRLIYLGRMLDDALKLCDYNIKDGNFVHLVPKPAGFVSPNNNGETNVSLEDSINLNVPDNIGIFGQRQFREGGGIRYNGGYMQELSLSLWRARVRLLGSLMLFYYFLQFMTNLSFWLHPDQADIQYEHGHHPTALYFVVDGIENVFGMCVAWLGLKCAASDSTALARKFFKLMTKLCFIHFVSLSIYTQQLLSGQIHVQQRLHRSSELSQSEVSLSAAFNFIVNGIIWVTCIGIASRYHYELTLLEPAADTTPAVGEGSDVENPVPATSAPASRIVIIRQ